MTKEESWLGEPIKLADLAFSVRLGKRLSEYKTNPPYVKAAKMLQERGINVEKGDVIKYVITKKGVKPLQLARLRDVNFDKYVELLKSMCEQILEPLGMDFDEITGRPRQGALERFWGKQE